VLASFGAEPVRTSELSPAEIVALRFPGGAWGPTASERITSSQIASNQIASSVVTKTPAPAAADRAPGPAGYALASADAQQISSLMFSPLPTYSSPAQTSPAQSAPAPAPSPPVRPARADPAPASAPAPRPSLPPQLATADDRLPAEALAYASEPARGRSESATAAPAVAKRAVPAPHPAAASASNAVLNSAQIASIRERLKLTSYQDQLWPPVESALRDISWRP
jgi:hypothetical protein